MAFAKKLYRDTSPFYLSIKQVPIISARGKQQLGIDALSISDVVKLTKDMNDKAAEMV